MLIPEAVAYYDAMAAERAEASGAVNSENLAPVPPLNAHSAGAPLPGRAYPLGVPPYPPAQGQGQTHTRRGGGDNAPGGYTGGGGLGASRWGFPAAAPAAWHAYPPLLPASAPCGGLGYRQGTVSASPLLVPGLQNRVSPAVFGAADPGYLNHTPVAQHPAPPDPATAPAVPRPGRPGRLRQHRAGASGRAGAARHERRLCPLRPACPPSSQLCCARPCACACCSPASCRQEEEEAKQAGLGACAHGGGARGGGGAAGLPGAQGAGRRQAAEEAGQQVQVRCACALRHGGHVCLTLSLPSCSCSSIAAILTPAASGSSRSAR